ncbi:MAG: aminotransferase class I/II-fold pyridoxal phosphate-dependent enzyme, partial [Verrucomicrobiota bacterium]|nr:aminotransferase class I/II-fold pyridoxal phosphate-dependent enzyme [Verrucomicrobiota bacterium]
MQFIDLKAQYEQYKPEIDARIQAVLEHGQFIMGPEIAELEKALAKYVGVKHAITVSSGTASLEIALRALGVGYGDEVITVPFTWISTAEVISLVNAKPVFVDINASDFNIDIDQMEAAITPRTKAIIPVSLFGQMPDFERINAIASKHGLPVIEDGAQSFGATQNGKRSCSVATIGSTSFFPAKPLGCFGDGGALFTNDDELSDRMRAIRNHGGLVRHHHTHVGTNGRFDTIQAAILLAKLPHFDWEVSRRIEIGARYTDLLDQGKKDGMFIQAKENLKENCQRQTILPPRCMPGNT